MKKEKINDAMTVVELARTANSAFSGIELRMQTGFRELRRDLMDGIRKTEGRFFDAVRGGKAGRPERNVSKEEDEDDEDGEDSSDEDDSLEE